MYQNLNIWTNLSKRQTKSTILGLRLFHLLNKVLFLKKKKEKGTILGLNPINNTML